MKKITVLTTALITAALFTGVAGAATDQQSEDILYGNGTVKASPGEPYVRVDSGPKEMNDYLLWNLHEIENAGNFEPYVQTEGERDNRDDQINNI